MAGCGRNDLVEHLGTRSMPYGSGIPPAGRPASIPVHDDGHMQVGGGARTRALLCKAHGQETTFRAILGLLPSADGQGAWAPQGSFVIRGYDHSEPPLTVRIKASMWLKYRSRALRPSGVS